MGEHMTAYLKLSDMICLARKAPDYIDDDDDVLDAMDVHWWAMTEAEQDFINAAAAEADIEELLSVFIEQHKGRPFLPGHPVLI